MISYEMIAMNPSFLKTMEKNIENLKAAQAFIEESGKFRKSGTSRLEELYLELQGLGFGRDRICQIWRAEKSGDSGQRFSSELADVVINRGHAVIYPKGREYNRSLETTEKDGIVELRVGDEVAHVSKGKVHGELVLRKWKTGERFQPSGMGGKCKKISDFLTGLKIDVVEKMKAW